MLSSAISVVKVLNCQCLNAITYLIPIISFKMKFSFGVAELKIIVFVDIKGSKLLKQPEKTCSKLDLNHRNSAQQTRSFIVNFEHVLNCRLLIYILPS